MTDIAPREEIPIGVTKVPGHKMDTILVIEGNDAVRELFAMELASERVHIVATGEVESIREKIEASNPDLVLLDIYMKGKLCWDVLMDMKGTNQRLPVILATALENDGNDPRLSLADGYWVKSYRFDDLKQKIGEILQGKQKILFQPQKGDKANEKAE